MEIENLKEHLLDWDKVDLVDNGESIDVDYHRWA